MYRVHDFLTPRGWQHDREEDVQHGKEMFLIDAGVGADIAELFGVGCVVSL